ncbi:MAG TPA: response regulator [Patescibacteria group bacterium]|nr:response regulator [Patescibacteria group bacterium]
MKHVILMVEDSDDDAMIIGRRLQEQIGEPLTLSRQTTLREACLFIEERKDDIRLVLLDLGLPDTPGMEETFRRVQEYCMEIPIVVLTGTDDHDLAVRIVGSGAQNFINKDHIIDHPQMLRDAVDFAISAHQRATEIRKKASDQLAEKDMVINWMAGGYSVPPPPAAPPQNKMK